MHPHGLLVAKYELIQQADQRVLCRPSNYAKQKGTGSSGLEVHNWYLHLHYRNTKVSPSPMSQAVLYIMSRQTIINNN